jgi:hypothetical protein
MAEMAHGHTYDPQGLNNEFDELGLQEIPVVVNTGIWVPPSPGTATLLESQFEWSGDQIVGGSTDVTLGVNGLPGYWLSLAVGNAFTFFGGDFSSSPQGEGQASNNAPTKIGTPKTSAQCSIYQDGSPTGPALYTLCSKVFPNGSVSNQIRGCLQSFYAPGSGYAPIPVILPTTPGSYVDVNSILPATGAHLTCFANAAGLF